MGAAAGVALGCLVVVAVAVAVVASWRAEAASRDARSARATAKVLAQEAWRHSERAREDRAGAAQHADRAVGGQLYIPPGLHALPSGDESWGLLRRIAEGEFGREREGGGRHADGP